MVTSTWIKSTHYTTGMLYEQLHETLFEYVKIIGTSDVLRKWLISADHKS